LGVKRVLFVGGSSWSLSVHGVSQTALEDASQVFKKLGSPRYLVVTNPADKGSSDYTALSALAPALAALHGGFVLPLSGGSSVSPESVKEQVQTHVSSKGIPDNLALFGGFNVVPVHCKKAPLFDQQNCVDVPYANFDDDMFLDVGLGRMIAQDLSSMSLLVSRIAAYDRILGDAGGIFKLAGHHKATMQMAIPPLENAGFTWDMLEESEVKSATKIEASAIIHNAHSWWRGLGGFYHGNSRTLLAPCVITSGGCQTAGFFEHGSHPDSVVLQLLHNGAVGFVGGTRNKITTGSQLHQVFWESLARGMTMGEAHIEGWNTLAVNNADGKDTGMQYVMSNTMLFGDPGFKLFVPSAFKHPTVRAIVEHESSHGSDILVQGPEDWSRYRIKKGSDPLPEWKWHADLFQYGAPGTSSVAGWAGKYDKWKPYFYAKVDTHYHIKSLSVVDHVASPLGYGGHFHVDEHHGGNRTVWWRVRMLDYNEQTGHIKKRVRQQRYKLLFD